MLCNMHQDLLTTHGGVKVGMGFESTTYVIVIQ